MFFSSSTKHHVSTMSIEPIFNGEQYSVRIRVVDSTNVENPYKFNYGTRDFDCDGCEEFERLLRMARKKCESMNQQLRETREERENKSLCE